MPANSKTIQVTLKAVADVSDAVSNMQQVQKVINQLKLPENLKNSFNKAFGDIEKSADNASKAMASGFKTKGDVNNYTKNLNIMNQAWETIAKNMKAIEGDSSILKDSLSIDPKQLQQATQLVKDLRAQLTEKLGSTGITQAVNEAVGKLKDISKSGAVKDFAESFKSGDIKGAEDALARLTENAKRFTEGSENYKKYTANVEQLRSAFTQFTGDASITDLVQQTNAAEQALDNLSEDELQKLVQAFLQVSQQSDQAGDSLRKYSGESINAANSTQSLGKELGQMKSRVEMFFGLNNAVRLFQRAVRSAFATVKDLDKVMTETAVVTDFSVSDMWKQLPEYTARANALGVSIHDMYEASTLYYQQGLSTNEVMAVSNETLKMARIAGLDAAEATDRMTNALRGFNMEITTANAQNINDVYSNLAAKTASDTNEISVAMTKVASLANNANMSFENTAAFLSQIIETTRESAETAGTALKTVIARFSEVKELYSEGQLLGTDEEGAEIDVNKVSKALRSAGIDLNEYLTGAKGLDQIFIELSSKWDSLDQVQQRYIATMAAGSRQQSRFIALMQNNARMTELLGYANNAAGASNEQFEKTLDSLESKLNQLKNAWNTFLMGVANDEVVKFAIDLLTQIITLVNNLTNVLPGLGGSILKILTIFGGLQLGKLLIKAFVPGFASLRTEAGKEGQKSGIKFAEGFKRGFNAKKQGNAFFQNFFTTGAQLGPTKDQIHEVSKALIPQTTVHGGNLTLQQGKSITDAFKAGGFKAAQKEAEKYGATLDQVSDQTKKFAGSSVLDLNSVGMAVASLGGAVLGLAAIVRSGAKEYDNDFFRSIADGIEIIGSVLMGVGAILPLVAMGFNALGWSATSAGIKGSIAGAAFTTAWAPVLAIVAGIIALIAILVVAFKAIERNSPEAKLKKLQEQTEEASKHANEAAEAYSKLNDSIDKLADSETKIDKLAKGTLAWRQAVLEHNKAVLDLQKTYKNLEITTDKNGIMHIDWDSAKNKQVLQDAENAVAASQVAFVASQAAEATQQAEIDRKNHLKEFRDQIRVRYINSVGRGQTQEGLAAIGQLRQGIGKAYLYNSKTGERTYYESTEAALADYRSRQAGTTEYQTAIAEANSKYRSVANSFISSLDLPEDEAEAAAKAFNATVIKNITDPSNVIAQSTDFKEYWRNLGYDVNQAGVVTKDGQELDQEVAKREYAAAKAIKEAGATWKAIQEAADKSPLGKALVGGQMTKQELEDEFTGENVVAKTIEELANLSVEEFVKGYDLSPLWDNMDDAAKKAYGYNKDEFEKAMAEFYIGQAKAFQTEVLGNVDLKDFGSLRADQYQSIVTLFNSVFTASGEEVANNLKATFSNITSNLTEPEDLEKFYSVLANIKWNDVTSIRSLPEQLEAVGLNADKLGVDLDGLTTNLVAATKATHQIDIDKIKETIRSLSKLSLDLKSGNQSRDFSEETKDLLVEQGVAQGSDFIYNIETDAYTYLGESTNQIVDAIHEQTDKLLGANDLDRAITIGEAFRNLGTTTPVDRDSSNELYSFLYDFIGGLGEDSPYSIDYLSYYKDNLSELQRIYDEFVKYAVDLDINKERKTDIDREGRISTLQSEYSSTQLTSQIYGTTDIENAKDLGTALLAQASAAGVSEEKIQQLSEALKTNKIENIQLAAATVDTAIRETNRNKGLKQLSDTYKTWTGILQKGHENLSTDAEQKAYEELRQTLINIFNITPDIADKLMEDAEAAQLIERAGNGDAQAMDLLQQKVDELTINPVFDEAAKSVQDLAENTTGDAKTALEEFANFLNNIDVTTWSDEMKNHFTDSLNTMLQNGYITVNDVNKILSQIGAGATMGMPTVKYKKVKIATPKFMDNGDIGIGPASKEVRIPYISWESGTSGTLYKPRDTKTTGDDNDSSSSGSGSGSSKSDKPEYWKNPFDELENLQERINSLTRDRNQLEREHEQLLKNSATTTGQIRKNYSEQIKSLREEIKLQQQMQRGRLNQIRNLGNEIYEDSEGNRKTFSQWGVMGYASFDERTGMVQIRNDLLDALEKDPSRTEFAKAVEEYINQLKERAGQYNDIQDAINDATDKIDELNESARELYRDFEDRVMDALVAQREKEIDKQEELYNMITETTSKVLDRMQEQIDLARQVRDNTKKEEDIADKETRLAYLRRDTSGANQLEILKLQKEIQDAQESYSDTLVDQEMQRLRTNADKAAEQRTQQIELMRAQLEQQKSTGALWVEVYRLIGTAAKNGGLLDPNSDLVKLLKSVDEFASLSVLGQDQYMSDLFKQILGAASYSGKGTALRFASGGLATYTGPAWLDGSKSRPELVLNSRDTENFITLKDILSSILTGQSTLGAAPSGGDNYFDIDIAAEIGSDYDVDQLADRIKQQIQSDSEYRNVNTLSFMR